MKEVLTDGPLLGVTFPDYGLEETGSTPVGFSLQRYGIGAQSFDFLLDTIALATPGAANVNQVFLDFILVPVKSSSTPVIQQEIYQLVQLM